MSDRKSGAIKHAAPATTCVAKRILLVEDDQDIAALVHLHLQGNGADVAVVDNGREALDRAISESWDLMILDLSLPDLDGIEVAKALKQQVPLLPIIVITARSAENERILGLDAGADDYVV